MQEHDLETAARPVQNCTAKGKRGEKDDNDIAGQEHCLPRFGNIVVTSLNDGETVVTSLNQSPVRG